MSNFVGSQTGDIPYESVFKHFGFSINFKEIDNNAYRENMTIIARKVTKKSGPIFRERTKPITVDLKADIDAN